MFAATASDPVSRKWEGTVLSAMAEPAENTIVVVGDIGVSRRAVNAVAKHSGSDIWFTQNARSALAWLDAKRPLAVLVPHDCGAAREVTLRVRAQSRHALTPIVSVADDVNDLTFAEAYGWGADDVVRSGQLAQLTRRLRALPRADEPSPPTAQGRALVVDSDSGRRLVIGRVLRNAGYRVDFALSEEDACRVAFEIRPQFVVFNEELTRRPAALVETARSGGLNTNWFFTCAPRALATLRTRLASVPHARAIDGYAPPENILFLANEVRNGVTHNQRATPRLLFGTSVWYRTAGAREDDVGFTYNLSVGGLYVRTLAPVDGRAVWVELQPPRSNRRVRLVGELVWQRPLQLDQHATTPPGFALKIVDGAQSDLDAWREGYEAFRADMGL